jgi:hypothetical protein
MQRLLLACGGGLAAVALTMPLACGSAFTTASATGADGGTDGLAPIDGTPSEGGAIDGTLLEAGSSDGANPGDGGVEASPPPTVVYVSNTTGDDGNDGTDPARPTKTIAQGLAKAQAIGAAASVEVCKGTYPEAMLTLVQSIPLRGSYDCSAWTRTATYGYPAFDGTNTTLIENKAPAQQAATLLITGTLTSAAIVDGFVIAGASISTGPTVGVEVTGSASPLIANDLVGGGGGLGGTTAGSIAVDILGGSPEVRFSVLAGGSGTGDPGSEAIAIISTGSPYVHDDLISGGTGTPTSVTSDLASVGVLARTSLTQATALKNLVVAGSDTAGVAGSSAGIVVSGASLTVDILGSAISGGNGALAGTFSEGIAVDSAGGMTRVLSDRIYGGNRTGAASQTYGVQVAQVGTLSVNNTEIHAGTALASMGAANTGIAVESATGVNVAFDTIYSGPGAGAALAVAANITGVVVTDDLLAGSGPANGATAVEMGSCSGELAHLDYTAFVNFTDLYSCPSDVPATTIPGLASALPNANTTGDIELQSICAASTSCVPEPDCPAAPATCLPSIFGASWTVDDGITGLFSGPPGTSDAATADHGWSLLGTSIPCALARGGTPIAGDPTDLFGAARDPSKPTIGAAEYSTSNCTN